MDLFYGNTLVAGPRSWLSRLRLEALTNLWLKGGVGMHLFRSSLKSKEQRSAVTEMRISRRYKRFLWVGLFALTCAVSMSNGRLGGAPTAALAAERPPMFVLQVGIGKYQHAPTWAELRGAVTDVVEMRKVLEGERWGIPPANIVTLTDAEGTKQNIFEKFQTHLIANAEKHFQKTKNRREGAIVVFQFSGHGSQAPDVDGDEKDDGKDETLVTVDSQDAPGKNYDITDDEIYALTSRLRVFTDNIVYIFDSCHSGSGTRDAQDVRRLPERKNPVVAMPGVGSTTRSGETKPEDSATGVLPPGDDYIVITAARANEFASQRNCFEECGETKRPVVFGNLTFYLIDELKNARSDTSYRELMENVTRRVVAEKPTQTPQLEGDKSRLVFSGLGKSEDYFIRIVEPETKKPNGERSVKIAAGAMQGVMAGTIVSFYDKAVTRFGGAEKIASGTVTGVSPAESTVRLIAPTREIAVGDKSVIIGGDLGSMRLKVNLDVDASKLSAAQRNTIGVLRSRLSSVVDRSKSVDVVGAPLATAGRWDIAVLKDKYAAVSQRFGGNTVCESPWLEASKVEAPRRPVEREVFYIAGKDFVPMFGLCVETDAATEAEQAAVAKRLEDALVHIARWRSVNAIANRRSVLSGKIVMRPVRLAGPFGCRDSRFTFESQQALTADTSQGTYSLAAGEVFWFEVTNNSPFDLYVALLNMPPDGSVKLFSPRERADEKDGIVIPKNGGKRILMSEACRVDSDGNFLEAGPFRASKGSGPDRFKLIASVGEIRRDDFAHLEMTAVVDRGAGSMLAYKKEWTTVETILQITDTGN